MEEYRINSELLIQFDISDMQDHYFFPVEMINNKLIVASVTGDNHDEEFIRSEARLKTGNLVDIYKIEENHFNREMKLINKFQISQL